MLALAIFSLITAVRLPSVKISPLLLTRVTSIILLYAGVLSFNCMYIQAIGSGIGIYSGLFQVTPVSEFIDAFIVVIGAIILIGWAPVGSLFLTKYRSLVRLECKSLYKKISSRIQVRIQLLCIWEFYVYLLVRRLVYSRLLRTILIWLYIFLCVILLIFGLIKCLIENGLSLGELSFSFNSNLIYIDIGGVKFITPSTSILEFNKPFFIHLINNTNIITDTIATSESYTIPASYNAWKTRPIGFDANFHIAKNFASIRSTPFDVDSVLVNLADTCKISFSTFNLIPHIGHLHVYLYEGGPASVLALVALKDPELGLVRIVVLWGSLEKMEIVHSMPVTRSHLEMSTLIIDEYVKAHSIILRRLRNLIIEQITLGTSPVCDHNLHQELSQLVSKGYIRKLNSDEFSVYKGITYNKSIGEWNKRFPRVLYDKNWVSKIIESFFKK